MQEIRVKKTAGDQLPQLEPHLALELGHRKMANGPECKRGEETWTGDSFQRENNDVDADQQFSESGHKNSLTGCAYFHTKVTTDHDGHNVTEIRFATTTQRGFDKVAAEL
jgi:hypothetical protein